MEDIVLKAKLFSTLKHTGQSRKVTKMPYIIHPAMVVWLVQTFKKSKNIDMLLASAYLHDVVEDCGVTIEEIQKEFGVAIASIVQELTNDPMIHEKAERLVYMEGKLLTMSNYALVIKLCDILHNLSDVGDASKKDKKFKEQFYNKVRVITTTLEKHRKLTDTQSRILDEIKLMLKEEK
jgi:(p)ppGpp synthase/HD superfamily hydrolase